MNKGKKMSKLISDAAVKEDLVIPVKPTDLSDEDLDKVAGGATIAPMDFEKFILQGRVPKGGSAKVSFSINNDSMDAPQK